MSQLDCLRGRDPSTDPRLRSISGTETRRKEKERERKREWRETGNVCKTGGSPPWIDRFERSAKKLLRLRSGLINDFYTPSFRALLAPSLFPFILETRLFDVGDGGRASGNDSDTGRKKWGNVIKVVTEKEDISVSICRGGLS